MKILGIDLDHRNVGLAFSFGWRPDFSGNLATECLSYNEPDPVFRAIQYRDRIVQWVLKTEPDVVVIEDYIRSEQKTMTLQKAALHAIVLAGLRDHSSYNPLYEQDTPAVVLLPVVYMRSYVHPHRYDGKVQHPIFGASRGLPKKLLLANPRSKKVPPPLLREHELDAAIWATIMKEVWLAHHGYKSLLRHEASIAAKIRERLPKWLLDTNRP